MTDTPVKKPHYHGHRIRLRERLLRDSSQLQEYELLELLLGTVLTRCDTKPLAKELISTFGSLRGILDAQPAEMTQVKGVGDAVSGFLVLLREVMARHAEAAPRARISLSTPQEVAHMARARLANCPHEEAWCAFVDNRIRLIAWERVSRGTVNATTIFPRDILEMALRFKASGLILVHNHPGGSTSPSLPDLQITNMLKKNASDVGIKLHDHVIVTDNACYSLLEDRLLD